MRFLWSQWWGLGVLVNLGLLMGEWLGRDAGLLTCMAPCPERAHGQGLGGTPTILGPLACWGASRGPLRAPFCPGC